MARSKRTSSSAAASPATSSRVSKRSRSSEPWTRQRARILSSGSSTGSLQNMADEAQEVLAGSSGVSSRKGKGRATADQAGADYDGDTEMHADQALDDTPMPDADFKEVCPITDKDTKPFPIMLLPPEIRNEIYRACLTRPYNILLSKRERPPVVEQDQAKQQDPSSDDEDITLDTGATRRAARALSARSMFSRTLAARAPRVAYPSSMPLLSSGQSSIAPSTGVQGPAAAVPSVVYTPRRLNRNRAAAPIPEPNRLQSADPLLVNILRVSKEMYKEARSVLYSENFFTLDLNTAQSTLSCLHQRSRRQIKHISLDIPTYNEILEKFQETVRLSLRYCTGLKKFTVYMPFTLPGADGSGTTGNTTVYANGFDILRWLPQDCHVILEGQICSEIEVVVNKHLRLTKSLDKVRYSVYQYCVPLAVPQLKKRLLPWTSAELETFASLLLWKQQELREFLPLLAGY